MNSYSSFRFWRLFRRCCSADGLHRLVRPLAALLAALLLVACLILPSAAQLFPGTGRAQGELLSQDLIPRFKRGNVEISPIFLDGKLIATIAGAIEIRLRDKTMHQGDQYDSALRAWLIHSRLQKYLQAMDLFSKNILAKNGITSIGDQERLIRQQLTTSVVDEGDYPFVTITFPANSKPETIYSVTQWDVLNVRFFSSEPIDIANRTAENIPDVLIEAWRGRQSPQLKASAIQAGLIAAILAIVSLGLTWLQRRVSRYQNRLTRRLIVPPTTEEGPQVEAPQAEATATSSAPAITPAPLLRMSLRQRLSAANLYAALLFWLHGLIWIIAFSTICGLFYFSRPLRNLILGVSVRGSVGGQALAGWPPTDWLLSFGQEANIGLPILVLFLLITTSVVIRAGNLLVEMGMKAWAQQQQQQRLQMRAPTVANAIRGWIRAAVYFIVAALVLYKLHELGTFTQAVAIFAGFLSFAISLASQSLLKDLINGLLILWEDQYAVGDVILVGDYGGLVEKVGLRITRLRNLDGELLTIPNGWISVVRNLSSEWSRVNYAIDFNFDTDVDHVLQLMDEVGTALFQDPEWKDSIIEKPEILGIDNIAHTGITIRMLIKTIPLQQWAVGREYRRRLKLALDAEGIDIGTPRLEMTMPDRMSQRKPPASISSR